MRWKKNGKSSKKRWRDGQKCSDFSELLERGGTVGTEMERNRAGAKIIEGWEQLVKDTACKAIGKKLILCNRAVKWWDEVKEAIRARRETHTRCLSSKSTVGWEEYAEARNAVKKMVEKKKGVHGKMKLGKQMNISMVE